MTSQALKVVATLLIRMPWDQERIDTWTPDPETKSHPGDIGNLMLMKCYTDESVLQNLEALTGLPGVDDVVVVYGDTSWQKYAEEKGIALQNHVCTNHGCEGFGGSSVMGEVFYYTGPL